MPGEQQTKGQVSSGATPGVAARLRGVMEEDKSTSSDATPDGVIRGRHEQNHRALV